MEATCCPQCDGVVSMANPSPGDRIRCPECGVELQVFNTDPLDLYFAFDYDEVRHDD